jgi:hypothetical protein
MSPPQRSGAGSGAEAQGPADSLGYLVRELDLEFTPSPPAPKRRGPRVGTTAVLVALVALLVAGIGLVGTRVTGSVIGGDALDGVDPNTGAGAADISGIDRYRGTGWIAAENEQPGTSDWIVPDDPGMWEKIRGYADATSIDHGDAVTLYVTTDAPRWRAEAYRMGYYQGRGGRLIWSSGEMDGQRQADAVIDDETNMAEARWEPSVEIRTDDDWPPGYYLVRLTSSDGGGSFVPLVVRDDGSEAPLLVQSSVTTFQAYNGWGGANHYTGAGLRAETRARVISFDRPYGGNGSGEFFGREFEFVYFVERLGLDVTYWTDIDLHERAELALKRRAVVSLGHDEYYSTAMRRGLEQARDRGVNIAFFGANAIFRKIRLEDSPLGSSRRQVNYRVASEDPLHGEDPDEVTVSWRDPPSNEPESSLIGMMYECNPVKADMVIVDAGAWMFRGTGLRDGDRLPDAVGNEYDRVMPEAPTPENIQVVAHSPVVCGGVRSFANASYYTHASGAGVFAVGTFWFIPPLKTDCPDGPAGGSDCQIQRIVENVLRTFAGGPAGKRHPSVNNLAELGIRPGAGRSPSRNEPSRTTTTRPAPRSTTPRPTGPPATAAPTTPPPTTPPPPPTPPPTSAPPPPTSPPTTGEGAGT